MPRIRPTVVWTGDNDSQPVGLAGVYCLMDTEMVLRLRWSFGLMHGAPGADHVDGDAELGCEASGGAVGALGQGVLDRGDKCPSGEAVCTRFVARLVAGGLRARRAQAHVQARAV